MATRIEDHDFDDSSLAGKIHANAFRVAAERGDYPTLPDSVRAALAARAVLSERQFTIQGAGVPEPKIPDHLLDLLAAGTPVDEAITAAVDAKLDHDRRTLAHHYVRLAISASERHLTRVLTSALPEVLGGLRSELAPVVETLRQAYDDVGNLDVHTPDPLLVAKATKAQRDALTTIAEQTKAYRRIRLLQRAALVASSLTVPGTTNYSVGHTWERFFATGLAEVSRPLTYGLPGDGQPARRAVRAVVTRKDVWLPDPVQMREAYEQYEQDRGAHAAQDKKAAEQRAKDREHEHANLDPGAVAALDAHTANTPGGAR